MQIRNTPPQWNRPAKNPVLDALRLQDKASTIDVLLDGDEYKNIDDRTAARMLGFFTETMRDQGFPWRISSGDQGGLKAGLLGGERLSEMEALDRLRKGQPIVLQPMRFLQLDLSSDSLGALAAAGALGGTDVSSVTNLANVTKNTKVSPGLFKKEMSHGEPVAVADYSELKLLYQLYNSKDEIKSDNRIAKTANQISHFTQESSGFAWRFYKDSDTNTAQRMFEAGGKSALRLGLAGAGLGAGTGALVSLMQRSWQPAMYGAVLGGLAFGVFGGLQAARDAQKGEPITAVDALQRVLDEEPVHFQKTTMNSVGVPFINRISWFSDDGKPNNIENTEDLDRLYWMANQSKPLPGKPEAKKEPEAPKPQVVIHQHLGTENNFIVAQ